MGYKIVYEGGQGEIVEKKSRFICTVKSIESEEEATAFVNEMKKKYWDARHNCSAFTIGEQHQITRCSDDGEPAQTAGRPMLDVLLKEDIHNVAVVVTRYFGGVLLGTGGLVRAYQKAVQEGLSQSRIIRKEQGRELILHTDYNGIGKLQYYFAQNQITVLDTEYTDKVVMKALIDQEQMNKVEKDITELTSGTCKMEWKDVINYGIIDKEIIILKK